jgi:hypothetical protein
MHRVGSFRDSDICRCYLYNHYFIYLFIYIFILQAHHNEAGISDKLRVLNQILNLKYFNTFTTQISCQKLRSQLIPEIV